MGCHNGRKWAAIVGLTGRPHWTGVGCHNGPNWATTLDGLGCHNGPNWATTLDGAGHPTGAALVTHFWAGVDGQRWAVVGCHCRAPKGDGLFGRPPNRAMEGHEAGRVARGGRWLNGAGRPREVERGADGHAKIGAPTTRVQFAGGHSRSLINFNLH